MLIAVGVIEIAIRVMLLHFEIIVIAVGVMVIAV